MRNYNLAGCFVPTTLTVGASLYDGLNPAATGASDMSFMPQFEEQQLLADNTSSIPPAGLFEDRLDTRLRDASLAWARQNPGRVGQLAIIKLGRMWNIWPNEAAFRSLLAWLIVAATYLPLMLLAAVGAWRFVPRGWPYVLCLLPATYFSLLHIVFVGSIRYRQPALLALMVLAGGAIAWWLGRNSTTADGANDSSNPVAPPAT